MSYTLPKDFRYLGVGKESLEYWSLPRRVWEPINSKASGKGVVIANLDTGYNRSHALLPKPIAAQSFVKYERDIADFHGHGSHTIGTCCGRDAAISPAFEADLIVAKVLGRDGRGDDTSVVRALRWAIDEGANIVNMSLGGSGYTPQLEDMILYAESKGVLVVAAAGNDGYRGINTIGYPAKLQDVLCVGAYREDGKVASFSSGGREMDIVCPGERITSCSYQGSELAVMSGTSMAAPFASALCAVILEMLLKSGAAWPSSVRWWLDFFSRNSVDINQPGHDNTSGFGVPDYHKLIERLGEGSLLWA